MREVTRSWIVSLGLSALVSIGCAAQTSPAPAALDALVGGKLDATRSPGLAAAVVKEGKLAWANGFGFADVAQEKPVTVDTLFLLASTSKTITAVAIMQLVESGKISLDDPIDDLPFPVKNRRSAAGNEQVTVRTLLTHTSSIRDPDVDLYRPGDTEISLERYLRERSSRAASSTRRRTGRRARQDRSTSTRTPASHCSATSCRSRAVRRSRATARRTSSIRSG
jgi:CubicO group peptidase (beta-lactamase class C family)